MSDNGVCARFDKDDFANSTRIVVINERCDPIIHTTLYVDEMRPSMAFHILDELNEAYADTVKLKQERHEQREFEEYLRLKEKYGGMNDYYY